jgi:hypothetical protein
LTHLNIAGNILPAFQPEEKTQMHFRERNQIVQIIRTKYDAAEKKGKNEIVGRMQKANPKLTDELSAALTKEERKEVEAWIESYATVGRLKRELAVRTLHEQLALAQEWFADQKGEEARLLAASLIPAWARFRGTLRKNGLIE